MKKKIVTNPPLKMNASRFRVGDRVRIVSVPGVGIPNYTIHRDTVRAYKKLIARGRSLRIAWIDEYKQPWFRFRLRRKNGDWGDHCMCIMDSDNNWVLVQSRRKRSRRRVTD